MRKPHLPILTATLSIALLAGCNWNKKGSGAIHPYGSGTGPGTMDPLEDWNPDDEFGSLGSRPFDQFKEPVPDIQTGLEVVYFGFDSSTIAPTELYKMDRAAAYLQNNPSHVMIIEGHCDERGSAEYNLSLGEFRAQAVRNYLVNLGIAGNRLQTRSFGYEKPAVTGSSEAVWAQNRRAVFAVYK